MVSLNYIIQFITYTNNVVEEPGPASSVEDSSLRKFLFLRFNGDSRSTRPGIFSDVIKQIHNSYLTLNL